jgi:membrane associated rhomboid family serine protease
LLDPLHQPQAPPRPSAWRLLLGVTPLTITLFFWHLSFASDISALERYAEAWARGALIPEVTLSAEGLSLQWWRLWSAPLAHDDWAHLISNLLYLALALWGGAKHLGWRSLSLGLRLSLLCVVSSSLAFAVRALYFSGWSLGLSGGVLSLFGLLVVGLWSERHGRPQAQLTTWSLLSLALLVFAGESGDQLSHVIGFCLGAGVGLLTPHLSALRSPLSAALTALLACGWVWGATQAYTTLQAPERLWSSWVTLAYVEELGGPALSHGLCAVGRLSEARALTPPWSQLTAAQTREQPLGEGVTLRAYSVIDALSTSQATLNSALSEASVGSLGAHGEARLHFVCLSPWHTRALPKEGQRALLSLYKRLKSP